VVEYVYEIDHVDLFQKKEVADTRMKINTHFTFAGVRIPIFRMAPYQVICAGLTSGLE